MDYNRGGRFAGDGWNAPSAPVPDHLKSLYAKWHKQATPMAPNPQGPAGGFAGFGGVPAMGGAGDYDYQEFHQAALQGQQYASPFASAQMPQQQQGYWVQPPQQQQQQQSHRPADAPPCPTGYGPPVHTFPKKGSGPRNPFNKQGLGFRKQAGGGPMQVQGKTPAMLMNEIFTSAKVAEVYDAIPDGKRQRFKCTITINGRAFAATELSKKYAKQMACLSAVRELRPDVDLSQCDMPTPPPEAPAPAPKKMKMYEGDAPEVPSAKKAKAVKGEPVDPLLSSLSLCDLMRKMILEKAKVDKAQVFEPKYDYLELANDSPQAPKRFKCTLLFEQQARTYTAESKGKNLCKDVCTKQALVDLFGVSEADLRRVVRRSLAPRLATLGNMSAIHHVAALNDCVVSFEFEDAIEKEARQKANGGMIDPSELAPATIGDNSRPVIATCVLTYHDGTVHKHVGDACVGRSNAKEAAIVVALANEWQIDLADVAAEAKKEKKEGTPPAAKLHELLVKSNRNRQANVKWEELEAEQTYGNKQPVFRCKCIVNETDAYVGSGPSKKAAKHQAALVAIKSIFKFDYNCELNNDPVGAAPMPSSNLCMEICEFAKNEYFAMCSYYAVKPSTEMAAFFLVNEKNEKRLVSIGSTQQAVLDGKLAAKCNGRHLHHMSSIVLARRSFVSYLIDQLQHVGEPGCIFEKGGEAGRARLNANIRVVLYATYPPDVRFSALEAMDPSLSTVGVHGIAEPVLERQSVEELAGGARLRVHSVADKIFKWTRLGVQGQMLSQLIDPIPLSGCFFGSEASQDDASLAHALMGRLGPPDHPAAVEANKVSVHRISSVAHVWTRDVEHVEVLNMNTGQTNDEARPVSRIARWSLAKQARNLLPRKSGTYEEMKRCEEYVSKRDTLYQHMLEQGMGEWCRTPLEMARFEV